MRKALILLAVLLATPFGIWAKEIMIKGVYQGEDLYILNPFSSNGVGYCIYEVTVNGQVTTDEINSSAFEIDFSLHALQKGDPVTVVIKHREGCEPRVLNPEVLKPKSTFVATSIAIDSKSNVLSWSTVGENGKLPFVVEQYRWQKWTKVGTVEGKGVSHECNYTFTVEPHTGLNRFRIKQLDFTKKPRYSKEVQLKNMEKPVTFGPQKVKDVIEFSAVTDYEIYNYYGSLILKGRDKTVNVERLEKGDYFINFDASTSTFVKK